MQGAGSAQLAPHPARRPTCRPFRQKAMSSKPWAQGGTRPERLCPADGDDRLQGPCAGLWPCYLPGLSQHTLLGGLSHVGKHRLGRKRAQATRLGGTGAAGLRIWRSRSAWTSDTNTSVGHVPTGRRECVLFSLKTDKHS